MYIGRPTTTIEAQALIGTLHYYKWMWHIQYHVLDPLTEAYRGPKGTEILWTNELEVAFLDLKQMDSTGTPLNDTDWRITLTVHTYASDRQLGAVTSQNNTPIASF